MCSIVWHQITLKLNTYVRTRQRHVSVLMFLIKTKRSMEGHKSLNKSCKISQRSELTCVFGFKRNIKKKMWASNIKSKMTSGFRNSSCRLYSSHKLIKNTLNHTPASSNPNRPLHPPQSATQSLNVRSYEQVAMSCPSGDMSSPITLPSC
ncbi:hypothetical protein AMELA_G00252770, partial [Ameiurus melas]